jgi:putative transcriptional regulator
VRQKPKSTKAGREIVAAAKEILAHLKGEDVGVRETKVWVIDVKEIRDELDMSQQEFAEAYGIPLRTVQSWEQGARRPDATARSYLRTIASLPKQVRSALKQKAS